MHDIKMHGDKIKGAIIKGYYNKKDGGKRHYFSAFKKATPARKTNASPTTI
jgi:hypothetical protein